MVDVEVQSAQSWKSSSQWHLCGDQGGWQAGSRRHLGGGEEAARRQPLQLESFPEFIALLSMNVSKCYVRYSKKRQMRKIIKKCLGKQGSTKDLACFLFHWCTGWLGINCEINERNKTRSARLPGKDFWPFSRDWRLRPGCNPLKFTAGDKPVLLVASCLLNGKLNQYKIPSLIWEGFTPFHPS